MSRAARRVVVVTLAALAVAVVLAGGVLAVIATTPFGARQALRLAAAHLPGELAVGAVEGSLYAGLEVGDVRYRDDRVDARIGSLSVAPSWRDIVGGDYVLERLRVGNGRIAIAAPRAADGRAAGFRLTAVPDGIGVRDLVVESVELDVLGPPIRIETLRGSIEDGSIELDRVAVEGAGASLAASAAATLRGGRATGTVRGALRLSAASGDAADGTAAGPAESLRFDTAFGFDEDAGDGRWQASLDWSRLDWRRPAGARLVSRTGRLGVRPGAGGRLDVELGAALEGEPLPAPASLTATAAVAAGIVDVEHARVELAGAEAVAAGAFDLDAQSGYASIDYAGVDPARLDAPLRGELRGRVDVAVSAAAGLTVAGSARIGGELEGRPLDGRLAASYTGGTLSIETGDVSLDGGRIVVGGMLAPSSADLRFSAVLPGLGNWYPPMTGAVTAAGSISGDANDPRVDVDFEGLDLAWRDGSVPALERVALRIDGTRAAHTLRLDAASPIGRVRLEAEQGYADGTVDGRLAEAVLEPRDAAAWRLAEPAGYSASTDGIELGTACFTGPGRARACGSVADRRLSVAARDVPNALAEPWLPEGFVVGGTTDAEADVALSAPLQGSVTLHHRAVRVGVRGPASADAAAARGTGSARANGPAGGESPPRPAVADEIAPLLDVGDVLLHTALDAEALEVELTGGLGSDPGGRRGPASLLAPSSLAGRLTLSPPAPDGRLDGFVAARLTELAQLGALADGVDALTGRVDVRAAVSGTPESPNVSGIVRADRLSAELPALGIDVTDGRVSAGVAAIAELDSVPFEGQLCSTGCARVTGRLARSATDGWTLTAIVEGDDVLVVDLPELHAVATPRLDVRATRQLASIAGTLSVPEASIEIGNVPRSAVRPARETVVHGRDTHDAEAQDPPIPLSIELDASLGDVRFEGLGLDAQLAGTLDVEHTASGDWILQGTTTIEEGTFSAYGQTLTIEQGLLVFTGPPENPALDIRAVRVVDGAEVVLAVTGTAENPQSEVFSAAGLSASEAFARLFTGRSLDELDGSDPDALERAALGLGLRQALPTLGRIGAALGLDELGVESPGRTEGAVVAGRQIGDDVYLRYRYGLFDDFSGLELIYRISERFRLRTQTGTAQSIDVIYEVEPGAPDTLAEDIEDIDVALDDARRAPAEPARSAIDAD